MGAGGRAPSGPAYVFYLGAARPAPAGRGPEDGPSFRDRRLAGAGPGESGARLRGLCRSRQGAAFPARPAAAAAFLPGAPGRAALASAFFLLPPADRRLVARRALLRGFWPLPAAHHRAGARGQKRRSLQAVRRLGGEAGRRARRGLFPPHLGWPRVADAASLRPRSRCPGGRPEGAFLHLPPFRTSPRGPRRPPRRAGAFAASDHQRDLPRGLRSAAPPGDRPAGGGLWQCGFGPATQIARGRRDHRQFRQRGPRAFRLAPRTELAPGFRRAQTPAGRIARIRIFTRERHHSLARHADRAAAFRAPDRGRKLSQAAGPPGP